MDMCHSKEIQLYDQDHGESKEVSSCSILPGQIEPKLRPVRANRGMKRHFPGDESDDNCMRRHTRIRSMIKLCGQSTEHSRESVKAHKGRKPLRQEGKRKLHGKKNGRTLKSTNISIFGSNEEQLAKDLRVISKKFQQENVELCRGHRYISERGDAFSLKEQDQLVDAITLDAPDVLQCKRPYACHYEGCNKRFTERSKLKRHFLIHTGEKSFICLYQGCGKAFSLDFNLRSHMKTHTGDYHECPREGCEKRYCQEYKLRAHICKDHEDFGTGGCIKTDEVNTNGHRLSINKVSHNVDNGAKKKLKLQQLQLWRENLEKWRDGRQNRIHELDIERESEMKELAKIEKALRKLEGEQEQLDLESSKLHPSSDGMPEEESGLLSDEEEGPLLFAGKLQTAEHTANLVQKMNSVTNMSDIPGSSTDLLLVPRSIPDAGVHLLNSIAGSQPVQVPCGQTNLGLYFGADSWESVQENQPVMPSVTDLGSLHNHLSNWRGVSEAYPPSVALSGVPVSHSCGLKGVSDAYVSLSTVHEQSFPRFRISSQNEHLRSQRFVGQGQLCFAD